MKHKEVPCVLKHVARLNVIGAVGLNNRVKSKGRKCQHNNYCMLMI